MARKSNKDQEKPSIIAIRKENGVITDYKLSNGKILSKCEAVEFAKEIGIQGVNVGRTRGENSKEILRANPTDDPSKALNNLPNF